MPPDFFSYFMIFNDEIGPHSALKFCLQSFHTPKEIRNSQGVILLDFPPKRNETYEKIGQREV